MNRITRGLKELFADSEDVTFYPTYGYREGSDWRIPMRLWVHEPRKLVAGLVTSLAESIGNATDLEQENLAVRIADIVADSESREEVVFQFDNDPEEEEWMVQSENGSRLKTDLNGIIEGFITLPHESAAALMDAQGSENGWLTYHAISREHVGSGRVRLIESKGLSIISDIDDTIKITEIPAGVEVVVRNTFLRDFRAAPDMARRYKELGEAAFHYVSGGPWQLYDPLASFIAKEGFPAGSFHMKSVPKNLLSLKTWKDLFKLVGDATVDQKLSQISEIMSRFPERKFILVGDSGEHDPDIYSQLCEDFGDQIEEIWIRDVVNERQTNPERLAGMTIIEAPTIVEDGSQ